MPEARFSRIPSAQDGSLRCEIAILDLKNEAVQVYRRGEENTMSGGLGTPAGSSKAATCDVLSRLFQFGGIMHMPAASVSVHEQHS